ncbi:MAG: DUF262 domain-containing protein [Neomegalonema sp.]|nr:DUF262 domain-containing protein [Neomegalonema sp.]
MAAGSFNVEAPIGSQVACLQQYFNFGRFRPASVQRSYRWGEAEAENLLTALQEAAGRNDERALHADDPEDPNYDPDDVGLGLEDDTELETTKEEIDPEDFYPTMPWGLPNTAGSSDETGSIFLGSVVCCAAPDGALEIYDGLQRTTTLTILFAVLRDLIAEKGGEAPIADEMVRDKHGRPRLTLAERDATLVEDVQKPGATARQMRVTRNRPIGRSLQTVKNKLRKSLNGEPVEQLILLAEFIAQRALVNFIKVQSPAMAREIFVSVNLYAKPLDAMEVLKGQLIAGAQSDDEEQEISRIWDEIGQIVTDPHAQFASGETQPRAPEPVFRLSEREKFLKAVDMIWRSQPQNPSWPTDFGEHVRGVIAREGAIITMNRLRANAKGWSAINEILREPGDRQPEINIWRLKFIPWQDWRPLALFWWSATFNARRNGRSTKSLNKMFGRLHKRCILLAISGLSDADRAKIFAKAMCAAKEQPNSSTYWKYDPTTRNGALMASKRQRENADRLLRGQIRDHQIWRALMMWREAYVWRDGMPDLLRGSTVEHLHPRQPDHPYMVATAGSVDAYDDVCFALGNLAVIPHSLNKDLGAAGFDDKRTRLSQLSTDFHTLADVAQLNPFGPVELQARTKRMRLELWECFGLKPP